MSELDFFRLQLATWGCAHTGNLNDFTATLCEKPASVEQFFDRPLYPHPQQEE